MWSEANGAASVSHHGRGSDTAPSPVNQTNKTIRFAQYIRRIVADLRPKAGKTIITEKEERKETESVGNFTDSDVLGIAFDDTTNTESGATGCDIAPDSEAKADNSHTPSPKKPAKHWTIRSLANVVRSITAIVVSLYLIIIMLINMPFMQTWMAGAIAKVLSDKLGTRVEVGRVDISLNGQLMLDHLRVWDLQGEKTLDVSRVAAKLDIEELIKTKRIRIYHAHLMAAHANIYQQKEGEPLNIQFIIDAFASKDTTSSTPIDLAIQRLVVRRTEVTFDKRWKPETSGKLNPDHLHLTNLNLTARLHALTPDSIHLNVDRLTAADYSGLTLNGLTFELLANKHLCQLNKFLLTLPNSKVEIPKLTANYPELPNKGNMREFIDNSRFKVESDINLTPSDLAPILPALANLTDSYYIGLEAEGNAREIKVDDLKVADQLGILALEADLHATNIMESGRKLEADIRNLHADKALLTTLHRLSDKIPAEISAVTTLSPIDLKGALTAQHNHYTGRIDVATALGEAAITADYQPDYVEAHVATRDFNIAPLLEREGKESPVGRLAADLKMSGTPYLKDGLPHLSVEGEVQHIDVKGYDFQHITMDCSVTGKRFEGMVGINDPAVKARYEGLAMMTGDQYKVDGRIDVDHADIDALGLLKKRLEHTFAAHAKVNLTGSQLSDIQGEASIKDFSMTSQHGTLAVHDINVKSYTDHAGRSIELESPYADATIDGNIEYATLLPSLQRMAHLYLPSFIEAPNHLTGDSKMAFDITVRDLSPINIFLKKPLNLPEVTYLKGNMNTHEGTMHLTAGTPEYRLGDVVLRNVNLACESTTECMQTNLNLQALVKDKLIRADLDLSVINDHVEALLRADNRENTGIQGQLAIEGDVRRSDNGTPAFDAYLQPAEWDLGKKIGTLTINRSHVAYSNKQLEIDSLSIAMGEKSVVVNGMVNNDPSNVITIDLAGISIDEIMTLAKVKPVRIEGDATGRVYVSQLFTKPIADVSLDVPNFRFNEGYMGHAQINGSWGRIPDNIGINALIVDSLMDATTHVVGQICPYKAPRGGLDLRIDCNHTNLHFINRYTSAIFSKAEGRGSGYVRVFGSFGSVDIEGAVCCNEVEIGLPFVGVDYHLEGDSVWLDPKGEIRFENATIYDPKGNSSTPDHRATISGKLTHTHFGNMCYDLRLDANNILGYNFREYGDMPFFGTVWATGQVHVKGRPGQINIDINARPEKGSQLEYNVTSPDAITNNSFITLQSRDTIRQMVVEKETVAAASTSDMHINFDLDMTPEMEMRLLMDASTEDYISLRGSGPVRAQYYNKGAFTLYGNYTVESGRYLLNLESLAQRRVFNLQRGGVINFAGNPFDSDLNLRAVYNVPTRVSLNSLSSASMFSDNKVPVTCIVDITGKLGGLNLDFDIDLPNAMEEEKQMVRSLINTDEERYTQFIYLIGLGRFYTYDYTGDQQQSYTAVNSLLSSTLSSQLNQMLSNVIRNNKWSVGANLATGEDGWNDMDVEGQLTGSLLNDRLVINGNFGYRDKAMNTTNRNFVGDFDVKYLLTPSGNIALKAYSETNDRYFTKSSLTTQGIGLTAQKDFTSWRDLFKVNHKRRKKVRKERKYRKNY